MQEQWRAQMKVRGFKMTLYCLPVLVLSLYASSKVSRSSGRSLWASKIQTGSRATFKLKLKSRTDEVRVGFKFFGLTPNTRKEVKASYRLMGLKGRLLGKKSMVLSRNDIVENRDLLASPVIPLKKQKRIVLESLVNKKSKAFKKWQVRLFQPYDGGAVGVLLFFEMFLIPALCFLGLGGLMMLFPFIV